MEKKVKMYFLGGLYIFISLLILMIIGYFFVYSSFETFTGYSAMTTGSVNIEIMSPLRIIIHSPLNETYNFNFTDDYIIDLNVSSTFEGESWWYDLWDVDNEVLVNSSVAFIPNSTIIAVRGTNKLIVYSDYQGNIISENVTFFVNVSDTAPIIGYIDPEIYICEGEQLLYPFNITDYDAGFVEVGITPANPFFVYPTSFEGLVYMYSNIISLRLRKEHVGGINNGFKKYAQQIYAFDGMYVDVKYVDIYAIEKNNPPLIENISVQTVWTQGDNSTFYKQVQVEDIEDGNQDSGKLGFNISFSGDHLFNISSNGTMEYVPKFGDIGVHNITVCVNDTGLENPHSSILDVCGQDGSSLSSCINFSLTVTDSNRPPIITEHYPVNLSFNARGTDDLNFNIIKYDPDGTVPDAYWYVEGVLMQYNSGSLKDEFKYNFGCGVSGIKRVKAEITDGWANDSVTWIINVSLVECPTPPPVTPRPPSIGVPFICTPNWVCNEWDVCQNLERSIEAGFLSGDNYRAMKAECNELIYPERHCGFQIRECFDLNDCGTFENIPEQIRACYFTEDPSCFDGIRNCHSGSCEIGIDCGGPCKPCPTCSDGIQNQGEEGIDCGGPCPWPCEVEVPLKKFPLWIVLLIVLIILLIFTIIKFRKFLQLKKEMKFNIGNRKI